MDEINCEEMSIEELIYKLQDIEERDFMLEMKDHWSHEDFDLSEYYFKTKLNLEKEIAKRRKEDGK